QGGRDHDVFLCHNSVDKPAVRRIRSRLLKEFGVLAWLDESELRPGMRWERTISERMRTIRAFAGIIGPNGPGPWQDDEVDEALQQAVNRGCPVIPVVLKDCKDVPKLPAYLETLKRFTWVDFRKTRPNPWDHLVWGITGKRKGQDEAG